MGAVSSGNGANVAPGGTVAVASVRVPVPDPTPGDTKEEPAVSPESGSGGKRKRNASE